VAILGQVKTIQVRVQTKHRLEMLGKKGDTFDDVISKLIDSYLNKQIAEASPVS